MKQNQGKVIGIPVLRLMTYFVVLLIATVAALGLLSNKVSNDEAADRDYISRIGDRLIVNHLMVNSTKKY